MILRACRYVLLAFGLMVLAACQSIPMNNSGDPVAQRGDSRLVQSENDTRHYRYLVLPNQLKVLLVSDPDADKSAASLDINVGSRQDPLDYQGLAHFLEHMLFLGTTKYPKADDYQKFISAHSGSHNAYTSFEHTNYYFDIDPRYFEGALDRFARFFIEPLFTEDYVEREINAVHSEYMSKLKDQGRKAADVFKSIIDPSHPYAKLSVGNLETLGDGQAVDGGRALRSQLLTFYQDNYSSGLMTLVLVGNGKLAREKFSAVKNSHRQVEPISQPILDSADLPLLVSIKPDKTLRTLSIAFPVDDNIEFYRTKPVFYIGNILGHEGEGSLLSYLKAQGWAEGLGAGQGVSDRNGATFTISILLTEAGLEKVDEIALALFQAINRIRVSGDRVRLYEEQKVIAAQQFRFQEKESSMRYAMRLSSAMHYYREQDFLRGAYMMEEYDASLVDRYLDFLVPENTLLTITAPSVVGDLRTHFYDTPYSVVSTPEDTLQRWRNAGLNALIVLPDRNVFLSGNMSILPPDSLPPDSEGADPELLIDHSGLRLWFKSADKFRSPRGRVLINFRSPGAADTPEHSALLQLFVAMVVDALNEIAYPARLADLQYTLNPHSTGLLISVGGFSDKQGVLLDRLLVALRSSTFDQQRFDNIRREHIRRLENSRSSRPTSLLMRRLTQLLHGNRWTDEQLLTAYKTIDINAVISYQRTLLSSGQADTLVYGNYSREMAEEFGATIARMLIDNPVPQPAIAITQLPDVQSSSSIESDYSDASLVLYIQASGTQKLRRAAMAVTSQWLKADFYTRLRTEKQLGYIVSSGAYPLRDVPGLFFLIQSPVAGPAVLHSELEGFLSQKMDQLAVITHADFLALKAPVITRLRESPHNQGEQSARYWQDISQGYWGFDFRERLLDALESLTLEQWRSYFAEDVTNNRKRLVAYTVGKFDQQSAIDGQKIDDIDQFKSSVPSYRFPQ